MPKSKSYEEFVEKFKPKKTTDDCMTPPVIYDTVKRWACQRYNIDPESIVRPFWPGGDYENYDYPTGCTVLDNPPFSILTKICTFYLNRGINFFLFAPSLTGFAGKNIINKTNHIFCDANITYQNGAIVKTSFITNYGGDIIAQTAPDLGEALDNAIKTLRREKVKSLPKYEYPDNVITTAMMQKYSHHGINFIVRRSAEI